MCECLRSLFGDIGRVRAKSTGFFFLGNLLQEFQESLFFFCGSSSNFFRIGCRFFRSFRNLSVFRFLLGIGFFPAFFFRAWAWG